jgi:adhesin/invasin
VEVDAAGNIYISDSGNNRIRKVLNGTIVTLVGTGVAGFGGDNGPAVSAQINQPRAIIFDSSGNMYIADSGNNRVRKVTPSGVITTVAGAGVPGGGGDGGQATAGQLNNPFGLAVDSSGNLFIADAYNYKIRRVDPSGIITTYAGTGTAGSSGDGGPAANATLMQPYALVADASGNLYISDVAGNKIRKIDRATGVITTFAGTGAPNFSGDGGPAATAQLNGPTGMAFDSAGNLYFTDLNNNRVRKIDTSGIITTVAGDGSSAYTNDGQPSLNAGIGSPIDVAIDANGVMYVAQRDFAVVRFIGQDGPPSRVIVTGGTGQSTPVSTAFPQTLTVLVTDRDSHPLRNVTVVFASPLFGASANLSSTIVLTDSNGNASVTATANSTTGSYQVTASVSGVTAPGFFDLTNTPAVPGQIVFQTQPSDTPAGSTMSPVTVRVTDSSGNPSATTVTMTAQGGTGGLTGTTTANTNTAGVATFSNLQISTTGTYQLKASAGSVSQLSSPFNITPGTSRIINVLSGNSQTASLGAAYASPLRVTVVDSYGNLAPGVSVTFSAPSSGPSVTFGGPATVTTDSNGIATSPVLTANSQTGAFRVTATTAGGQNTAVFDLMNVAAPASKLAFVQQPSNAAAGQVIAPPVTVQLQDSFGNPVPQAGVPVTLQAVPLNQPTRTLSGTVTQTTNSAGLASFADLSTTQPGTYQLLASAGSYSTAQSNPFTITAGSAASIATAGGTPQTATISTAFANPLAVVVRDASGNPVPGATVTFAAPGTGASAALSAAQANTDASGRASVTATANNIAGSYTVTASVSGVSGKAAFALTNAAAGASVLAFVQQPTSTTAGATISAVMVKLTDSGNNPVGGVAVTLSAQGGAGSLEGTLTGTTDITGTVTFNDLRITAAGTYQLKAVAGALSALSNSFQITPAAAANITVFSGNGQTAAVGTAYGSPLRASVVDAFGNPIPNASVTFTAPASGASVTFAGSSTVATDSSGIAVSPVATANQTAGAFQVTATTAGAPQPATFNLTNAAGAADQLAFTQQPVNTVAGQTIAPPVVVQLQDSAGNPVAMAGVSVNMQGSPVTGRLGTVRGTATAVTDSTGKATFSSLSPNQVGTYTLLAQATGVSSATSVPFTVTAGIAAAIQATGGTPQNATVNLAFANPLQATVTDALGNPVSGVPVTFTAPGSGASAALSAGSAVTDSSGHASVTAIANSVAGAYQVTATAAGVSGTASFALTNLAAGAASLVFVQQPASTTAGAVISAVTVRISDGSNNPVSGTTVTLSTQVGSGTLEGTLSGPTDITGTATFNDLRITAVGAYQLKAVAGALSALSNLFKITPAAAANITVFGGNGQTAAVGTAYGSPLRASVLDVFGNAIANAQVTFQAPASGASVTFATSATVATDSSGIATSPVATANGTAGAFQVTATTAGAPQPATFNLTNVAGTANKLAFAQQPSNTVAGQVITPPVVVQLQDSFGNAVAMGGVSVSLQATPVVGRVGTVRGTVTAVTDSTGRATFADLTPNLSGTYTLLAQATGVASATSVQFTVTAGIAVAIQATGGTPQRATIKTDFSTPLQATVTDALGNPVSGVTVTFTAPGSGASAALSAASAVTDASGHASVTATANATAGTYQVTAVGIGVSGSAGFTLTNLAAGAASLVFVQQPASTTAGAVISAVTVRATDANNNPVSGISVTLSAQGGTGTLEGTVTATTDVTGTATFNDLTIQTTGTYQLQASAGTLQVLSESFQIAPAATANITVFDGNGQTAAVGTVYGTPLRASVQDAFGNPVAGAVVTFTAPATGPSVTFEGSSTVTTNAAGIAAAPAATANGTTGTFQVTATTPGAPQPATFNLMNVVGTANKLGFTQQPSDTQAGRPITPAVTVQLQDSFGNPVGMAGVAVSIQANPATTRSRTLLGTSTAITDATGLARFPDLSLNQAGAYTLTAQAAEITSAVSHSFQITAGPAASVQIVGGTPQTTPVLTAFPVPLQVAVMDAFGNPVSGIAVSFTAPLAGASATLSSFTVLTDGIGHASVTATANGVAGSYTVTAAVAGGSATFALTNVAGGAASIVFVQQPQNTQAGATMPPVSVRLTDSSGNPVGGTAVTVSIPLFPGRLGGTTTVTTDSAGLAVFNDLTITVSGTYKLSATTAAVSALSASFDITPATSGLSITVVDGSGQSTQVTTAYGGPLRALVRDTFGNLVAGATVTFTAPATGASATFDGAATTTATTDGQGIATSPIPQANAQAGDFTVTASAAGAAAAAGFSLTNLPGSANKLAFRQQPANIVAGQPITPAVTVQLEDSAGNAVSQPGVTVTLQSGGVTRLGRSLSGTTSATTDSTGLATFSGLTESQVGTYVLLARATGVASATSVPFTVTAGSAAAIQATGGTQQNATINTVFATALQATVSDALGNPVSGVTVTFTAPGSGASAALSAGSAVTDTSGHASVTATANSVAGTYQVTAAGAGVTGTAAFALTNQAAGASSLAFVQQPASTTAGAVISAVTVRISDAGNNPVSGTAVTLSAQGGTGPLEGTLTATTDVTGTATFNDLTIRTTGTYRLEAVAGALSALSTPFQITPAAAANITVFGGNGQTAVVGAAYGSPLRASVVDAFGNPIADAAVTFTAPASGASVTFAGTATVSTDSFGVATSPVATANGTAGAFQVTAATAGAPQPATFNLTNVAGTANKLAFAQQPSNTVAGQTITPPVAVQLEDNSGNPVAKAGVSVNLQATPVVGRLGTVRGALTAVTDSTGRATFANLTPTLAGTYTLTAEANGVASATSAQFTVAAGSAAAIEATGGTPQGTIVNTSFARPLQATVTDALGNPVSGVTVTFTVTGSGASAVLSAASAVTDASGHASVTAAANSVAGTYQVTAAAAGVSGSAVFALTNLAAGAASLAFVEQPTSTTAGAVISAVTVRATDAGTNPVSGIAVTLSAQGGTGTLQGTLTATTDVTGTAAFNDLTINTTGTYQLQAVAGALHAVSGSFQISPAAAANITVFDGNGQTAAVGKAYGAPLRASVQDAFGNPVANAAVTFTAPTTGPSVTFAGSSTVTTNAMGIAAAPTATANGTPGTFQVTATTAGAPQPAAFNLTNVPGTANQLGFTQQPSDTAAGQPITPDVTVQLQDSFGNPVAKAGVAVNMQANPATTRSRAVRGATSVLTDAAGLARFPDLSINQAGDYTLTANAATTVSTTSDQFSVTVGPATTIRATGGTPQSATILTPFAQSLQATVLDASGNPVAGVTVTFTAPASGASATLSAGQATTGANGQASVTATANGVAGSYTVQASIPGIASAGFQLTNVAGGASTLAFVQQPVNTPAGAAMSVSVKLVDNSGNPVAGMTVTLSVPDNAATIIGTTSVPTDGNGLAAFNDLSITTAGTFQLQATAGGLSTLSNSFQITPAGSRAITPAGGGGQSAAVNGPYALPLSAVVKDQLGNPVPGVTVTFTAPGSGPSVVFAGSASVTTDSQGVATSSAFTANAQTGSFQVSAATDNAPSPAVFSLTNLAGTAHRLTFVQQPTSTVAGQTIVPPVTVQVQDSVGNPVAQAGVPVTLAVISPASPRVQPPVATTDSTGLATFATLSIAQAGTYTAQAQAAGLASATSAPFTIAAGVPSAIQPTGGTPQDTTVSAPFSEALQATVTDSHGNPVSGVSVVFMAPLAGASATFGGATTLTVVTDQQGRASAAVTANNVAGSYIVTASTALATGQAQFALANVTASVPILAFAQQPSNSAAGQTISPPVTVRIVDSSGTPVPMSGVPVAMSLASGSGVLSGTLVKTTDATGTATFGDLSIDQVGTFQLRAISGTNVPAVSNAFQVSAGLATGIVVISGSPQSTTPSQQFPSLLQARVTDSQGNPAAGVSVSFAAPAAGPSGSFSGSPVVATDANGLATSPPLTANNNTGNFAVSASAQGVAAPTAFALTIIPNAAGALQVLPSQIEFASESGQPAPAPQTVQVANTDGRIEAWTSLGSAPWLAVSPPAGNTPAAVNIGVNPAGLEPGFYSATVSFTTPTGEASLFVVYRITPKPALTVSPSSLLFLGVQQGAPPAQTLSVTSTGRAIAYQVAATVSSPPGSSWLQVSGSPGQTPGTVQVGVNTSGLASGVYHGSVILTPSEAGLTPVTVPVTLALGPAVQAPVIRSVTNSGSFHSGGAPGALMTIFGIALSDAVYQAASLPLPDSLGPTTVTVNGVRVPLIYASPTQVNFQMPSALPAGTVQVVVTNAALQASSDSFPVGLIPVDPGLFVTPDGRAAALNQDLTVHTAATPQPAGAIIVLYLTGQGPTSPPVPDGTGAPASPLSMVTGQVAAEIGGKPADVVFAGLTPGLVGDTQVNVRIPQGVDPGDRPVFITINGVPSNAGIISVR